MVVLAEVELRVAAPMETELRVAAPTVARVVARVVAVVVAAMVVVMVAATRAVTMVVVTGAVTRAVAMVAGMVAATRAVAMVVVMVAATRVVALVIAGGRVEEAEREASSVAPKELPVVPVGRLMMTRWSSSAQRRVVKPPALASRPPWRSSSRVVTYPPSRGLAAA